MTSDHQLIFKQPRLWVVLYDLSLAFVVFGSIWMTSNLVFFDERDSLKAKIGVIVLFWTFSSWLAFIRTYIADIHLDDEGIGWWVYGRQRRFIRWADIKVMTIRKAYAAGNNPPIMTFYSFYRTEKTPVILYPLKFTDDTPNIAGLVTAVMQYVRQHNITVQDKR